MLNKRLSYQGNYIDERFLSWFSQRDPSSIDLGGRGLNQLFRDAVKHQTMGLRRRTGIMDKAFSLDHYPVDFSTLKWIFLKSQGFNPCDFTRAEVTTEILEEWQYFHGALAEYRILTTHHNRLLGRRQSDHWIEYN